MARYLEYEDLDDGYDSDHYDYDNNPVLAERKKRRERRRNELFQLFMTIVQALSVLISLYHYYTSLPPCPSVFRYVIRIILLICTLLFFSLWLISRIQLGAMLTFQAKANGSLVTTGLYSKFKHPIYYFGTVSLAFFILLIEQYRYLLVFCILIPFQMYRAAKETKVLKDRFDDLYMDYVEKVWI